VKYLSVHFEILHNYIDGLRMDSDIPSVPYTVIQNLKFSKTYVTSQLRGYVVSKKVNESKTYLKCKFYHNQTTKASCGARAVLNDGVLTETVGHVCERVDQEYWNVFKAKLEMKKRANSSTLPLRDIWSNVLSHSSKGVKETINFPNIESTLKYQRKLSLPPIPQTVDEAIKALEAGEHPFGHLYKGWVSFQKEGGTEKDVGLIFASDECLDILPGIIPF